MRHHGIDRRIGLIIHGRQVWISELTGLVIAAVLLLSLLTISWNILKNERTIYQLTGRIATRKSDRIILLHFVEELKERVAITELLQSIAGKRLSQKTLLELSDIVYTNSTTYGYDPMLLLAVIQVESVFETKALGKYRSGSLSGALGLMQLKLSTAREVAALLDMDSLSEADLFRPEINVVLGVAYLTTLISKFKNFKLGILAYNQGPGFIRKQLSENAPLSVGYYRKILNAYYTMKKRSNRREVPHD